MQLEKMNMYQGAPSWCYFLNEFSFNNLFNILIMKKYSLEVVNKLVVKNCLFLQEFSCLKIYYRLLQTQLVWDKFFIQIISRSAQMSLFSILFKNMLVYVIEKISLQIQELCISKSSVEKSLLTSTHVERYFSNNYILL